MFLFGISSLTRKMANVNPNESEYERQFREDLEKATALSMETLALDQFRRNKLYSNDSRSEHTAYGSTCMHQVEVYELLDNNYIYCS